MAMEMLARPRALATTAAIMISPPLPPYSSGMARPVKPCSLSLCHNPAGKASSRSISAICGRISFCPNPSALPYASWCSSESSKSIDTRLSCREMEEQLHSEYTERIVGIGCVQRRGDAQGQHVARINRVDDAIVPHTRRAVIGAALICIFVQDRLLKGGLLLGCHCLATCGQAIFAHRGEHVCSLLAAHD